MESASCMSSTGPIEYPTTTSAEDPQVIEAVPKQAVSKYWFEFNFKIRACHVYSVHILMGRLEARACSCVLAAGATRPVIANGLEAS